MTTLLAQIRSLTVIDADTMDPDLAERHAATAKYADMTSNQAIVYGQAIRPERLDLVKAAIQYVKDEGKSTSDTFDLDVIDVLTVKLGKEIYPLISGNLHAQTTPAVAYDTEKTIEHAKKLVSVFEAHGVPKNRVCIKIPTTPESILACKYLSTIGIHTLATALFSVPQAIAASQADCDYVAPYYNELRVHFEPALWKDYHDPASEHPLSATVRNIVLTFKDLGTKTLVMPASIVTAKEVIGLASLQPHHLTLSAAVLDQLAGLPPVDPTRFQPPSIGSSLAESYKDKSFLSDGAKLLKDALNEDPETTRKLADALALFDDCEKKTKEFIQKIVQDQTSSVA